MRPLGAGRAPAVRRRRDLGAGEPVGPVGVTCFCLIAPTTGELLSSPAPRRGSAGHMRSAWRATALVSPPPRTKARKNRRLRTARGSRELARNRLRLRVNAVLDPLDTRNPGVCECAHA